jgi:hypothetical protein
VIALYVPSPPRTSLLRPPLTCSFRFAPAFSFAVLAGMGSGGYFSLQSSIVAQSVGSHRVGAAIGAIELVSSIGTSSPIRFFRRPVAEMCG